LKVLILKSDDCSKLVREMSRCPPGRAWRADFEGDFHWIFSRILFW